MNYCDLIVTDESMIAAVYLFLSDWSTYICTTSFSHVRVVVTTVACVRGLRSKFQISIRISGHHVGSKSFIYIGPHPSEYSIPGMASRRIIPGKENFLSAKRRHRSQRETRMMIRIPR